LNAKNIIAEVGSWPVNERLRLIEEIWEGIASAEEHTVLDEAMKRDLERRLEAYREQPRSGSPWHEVAARIRGATS